MKSSKLHIGIILSVMAATLLGTTPLSADEASAIAEMQRRLNQETMAQAFDPGDIKKIDAYVAEAMKKDLKPVTQYPTYWQTGYTCDYIRRFRYNYRVYRDCLYHYRYYGYYWGGSPPVAAVQAAPQVVVQQAPKKTVVVEEAPATVTVRRNSSRTIDVDEFDEDAMKDYYNALKSAVEFLTPLAALTVDQLNQMTASQKSQFVTALNMMVSTRLQTAQIELAAWPADARREGWSAMGKRIDQYTKLFEDNKAALIANGNFDNTFLDQIKKVDLLTEEKLMGL